MIPITVKQPSYLATWKKENLPKPILNLPINTITGFFDGHFFYIIGFENEQNKRENKQTLYMVNTESVNDERGYINPKILTKISLKKSYGYPIASMTDKQDSWKPDLLFIDEGKENAEKSIMIFRIDFDNKKIIEIGEMNVEIKAENSTPEKMKFQSAKELIVINKDETKTYLKFKKSVYYKKEFTHHAFLTFIIENNKLSVQKEDDSKAYSNAPNFEKQEVIGIEITTNSIQYSHPQRLIITYDKKTKTATADVNDLMVIFGQNQDAGPQQVQKPNKKILTKEQFLEITKTITKDTLWFELPNYDTMQDSSTLTIKLADKQDPKKISKIALNTGYYEKEEQRKRYNEIIRKIAEIYGNDITDVAEYD